MAVVPADSFQMGALEQEMERTGVSLERILNRYQISSLEEMTDSIYSCVMRDLRKSKDRKSA